MVFHVSNLNTRLLDLSTNINLMQTLGKFDMWVTPKTNRSSFCLILKLSHALDEWSVQWPVCYLGCMKDHWTWLLSNIVAWDSFWHGIHQVFIFRSRCCDGHFPLCMFWMVNTYFLNFRPALLIVLRVLVHLI